LEALGGAEINDAKKILATEITRLCHGEAVAEQAAETARQTFEAGQSAEGLPTVDVPGAELALGLGVVEALRRSGLVASNGEARRLIKGGGARVNDAPITDEAAVLGTNDVTSDGVIKLSSGKKRHALLKIL
jgi:tyrosyl-tRNA synthetase